MLPQTKPFKQAAPWAENCQDKLKLSAYAKSIHLWSWSVVFVNKSVFLIQFIARSRYRAWGLHCDEDCREAPQPFYSLSESLRQRVTAPRCHQCTDRCTPVSSHSHWQAEKAAGLNRPPAAHFPCSLNPPLPDVLSEQDLWSSHLYGGQVCVLSLSARSHTSRTQPGKEGECFLFLLWSYSVIQKKSSNNTEITKQNKTKQIKEKSVYQQPLYTFQKCG